MEALAMLPASLGRVGGDTGLKMYPEKDRRRQVKPASALNFDLQSQVSAAFSVALCLECMRHCCICCESCLEYSLLCRLLFFLRSSVCGTS
eukprot:3890794-Pleurochrysis_carterae.AAC.2